MQHILDESKQLNRDILESEIYKRYLSTRQALYADREVYGKFTEFRRRNYELQNLVGINPYDEVNALVREYDDTIHNSLVSDYVRAEQKLFRMLKQVYENILNEMEIDYTDERQ